MKERLPPLEIDFTHPFMWAVMLCAVVWTGVIAGVSALV